MFKKIINTLDISNKNDLDTSFKNIYMLLDLNKINEIPDNVIELHNYIVDIKKNTHKLLSWYEMAKKLETELTNFSSVLINEENGSSVSEDWFVEKREKYIFRMIILYEFDTNLSTKLTKLSNLFAEAKNTDLHDYSLGVLGHQITSMQIALSILEPIVNITRECFIELTQHLTYGEVLGSAIKRVFSHISPDTPLKNQSNLSKLRAILPGNNLPTKADQPTKIWNYTQEKEGPTLSNLQRKFFSFIEQVETSLPNDNKHIKDMVVNDIKISEGLFLLALLHIKKTVQQKNPNLSLQDSDIRIPSNILTDNYQEKVSRREVWVKLNQKLVTFCENHALLKEKDQRKYPTQNDIKTNFHDDVTEIDSAISIISAPSTPLHQANLESLHTPKKRKKNQQQIVDLELTPKKTNIRICYVDGSERIVPVEALAGVLNNNSDLSSPPIQSVYKNPQQLKMTSFGKVPKQNEEPNADIAENKSGRDNGI